MQPMMPPPPPRCLTHHAFDDVVLSVVLLHLEKVVAEVQDVKASLLAQQGYDHTAGPVQPVSEALPETQKHTPSLTTLSQKHSKTH